MLRFNVLAIELLLVFLDIIFKGEYTLFEDLTCIEKYLSHVRKILLISDFANDYAHLRKTLIYSQA